jgi:hypothetical protein
VLEGYDYNLDGIFEYYPLFEASLDGDAFSYGVYNSEYYEYNGSC